MSRRLTAIVAADIASYSALMGADEVATVRDLKGHQSVIFPMIAGYSGRIIDTAGDGVMAEFASVLNAVKCAAAIQETMAERNAAVEPDRRMQFRIGINQGDVVFDEQRIYGDGINIAARLEGVAEPGGICISGKVYEEIKGKVELQFIDMGEQQFKNIPELVRTYKVRLSGNTGGVTRSAAQPAQPSHRTRWPPGECSAPRPGGCWRSLVGSPFPSGKRLGIAQGNPEALDCGAALQQSEW